MDRHRAWGLAFSLPPGFARRDPALTGGAESRLKLGAALAASPGRRLRTDHGIRG
jgi:hypothetical protein